MGMGYTGVAELKQKPQTAVYVPTNKKSRKGGQIFIKLKEWLWLLWLHKLDVGTGTPDLSRILSISS